MSATWTAKARPVCPGTQTGRLIIEAARLLGLAEPQLDPKTGLETGRTLIPSWLVSRIEPWATRETGRIQAGWEAEHAARNVGEIVRTVTHVGL